MKKLMIASAIAMTMVAGSAMASTGDVQFFGNVSATTCDVTPEVGGTVTDLVQLGTVTPNGEGEKINVVFKATNAQGAGCTNLNGKTASFAWSGNLNANGIGAQGGLAQDAYVILTPANGNDANPVTSADYVADFDAAKATTDGFEFTAQLKGGDTPGDFQSAAAYAVTYQ
ncbi:TPA: fimbrial protein [Escherichia coli]|uniref:F107 fimbrial protein n=1 Tax=Escherichia coli TaxID=562 RepID=UPI000530B00E|nr:F107 fimbrial protein [Escherichia coli]HBA8936679.1 fimbrial protein [Escherichia coli]HBA8978531.1 fimbrial protein [Escherichia coli]HBA9542709.1 fimbrial protein [Escherichia coli]